MKRALFLDRDGVINVDYGYVCRLEEFHFIEGIFDLVHAANKAGFLVIVVTNQAGIARGYYTEQVFLDLMNWMQDQFIANKCHIDAIYYSPFHPEFGLGQYLKKSDCRKPSPGMLFRAAAELCVNLEQSIMVGDKQSDMQAALAAKIKQRFQFKGESGLGVCIDNLSAVIPFIEGKFDD